MKHWDYTHSHPGVFMGDQESRLAGIASQRSPRLPRLNRRPRMRDRRRHKSSKPLVNVPAPDATGYLGSSSQLTGARSLRLNPIPDNQNDKNVTSRSFPCPNVRAFIEFEVLTPAS
jgi:hypothetical protein